VVIAFGSPEDIEPYAPLRGAAKRKRYTLLPDDPCLHVNFAPKLQIDRIAVLYSCASLDEHPLSRQIDDDPRIAALSEPHATRNAFYESGLDFEGHGDSPLTERFGCFRIPLE
jgi:hypothetical protein